MANEMNIKMREPCKNCGCTTGFIVPKGPHREMKCTECDSYVYFVPKERPKRKGYEEVARLHKVTKNGSTFYVGKDNINCPDCGTVRQGDLYLFREDDGSVTLNRKEK